MHQSTFKRMIRKWWPDLSAPFQRSTRMGIESLEDRLVPATWSGDLFDSVPGVPRWTNNEVQQVVGNVHVPAGKTLTIQPGTVIQFSAGTNLTVDGTLNATGSANQRISFTSYRDNSPTGGSNSAGAGDWGAIRFNAGSDASTLDHVRIRYGGYSGGTLAAEVIIAAPISITNSTISDSYNSGVRINGSNPTLTADTFSNNYYAGSMDLGSSPAIQGTSASGNTINGLVLDAGSLPGNVTWNSGSMVYRLSGDVTVPAGKTLAIGAGQVIKGYGTNIVVNGTMHAAGASAAPVIFTSFRDDTAGGDTNGDGNTTGVDGDWGAITFNPGSDASSLDHVVVRYGGYSGNVPAEVVIASNISVSNSTFASAYQGGMRITNSNPTLTSVTWLDNVDRLNALPFAVSMDLASHPVITNPTMQNNGVNGVLLDAGTLPASNTWDNPDIVYELSNDTTVPVGTTLTIAAGQVVKFANNHQGGTSLLVDGSLHAAGTRAQPVVFTSYRDDAAGGDTNNDGSVLSSSLVGDWGALQFGSGSTGNVIDHAELRYGGFYDAPGDPGTLMVSGSLALSNSIVREAGYAGIVVAPGASATLTNNIFARNHIAGVQAQAGATLTAVNNTIDGTDFYGFELESPTATLINNLITNNRIGIYQPGPTNLTMRFNDVFNSSQANYSGLPDQTGTNGNLSVDPQYTDRAALQFQLKPGSPVEDAGTNTGAPATDFFGNAIYKDPNIIGRGDGSGKDMGAIEVQETAASKVDLATSVVNGPATGLQGQSVTVNWTVQSVGTDIATGSWHDAVYLSASPLFTPDAILLGEVTHNGDLAPNQTYNGTGTFVLPGVVPGNYYILVRSNSRNEVFETTALANNVLASAPIAMDVPALTLGIPVTGQLPATGASQLYKLIAPGGGDRAITLNGPSGNSNELYVSFGNAPSRQAFQARGARIGSANQSVAISSTLAGTYYILVYGSNVPSGESFTLTASAPSFSISGVSPVQGSNAGKVTLSISGAQFDGSSQPRLVDSSGATLTPQAVYYTDSGLISATFDLTGRPTGPADVKVVNTGGVTQILSHGFNIMSGQPGQLVAGIASPSDVRLGRLFAISIQYRNAGGTDLVAPQIRLSTSNPATKLSFFSDLSEGADSLDMLAINTNGPAGVLPPGAQGEIVVYAASTGTGASNLQLSLSQFPAGPIDWTTLGATLKPENYTAAQWTPVVNRLSANIGTNYSAYQAKLAADASLLPHDGGLNYSVIDVFNIEVQKALAQLEPSLDGHLFLNDTAHPLGGVGMHLFDPTTGVAFDIASLLDGSFLVPGAGPGTYHLRFDNYVSTTTTITVGSGGLANQQIILTPAGQITGSVALSPTGAAVAGTIVSASLPDGSTFSATTDLNGKFALNALPGGTYVVRAGGGAYSLASRDNIVLAAGSVAPNIALVVQPGSTIKGTVTGPSGPLANALVSATGADGLVGSALTNSDGTYSITNLTGQTYTVGADVSGLFGSGVANVVVASGGTVTGVNVALSTAGGISGTVKDTSGAAVANVLLTIQGAQTSFTVQTDSNGAYAATSLRAGSYTVTAATDTDMTISANATVTVGATTTINLTLAALGTVSGTVTNSINGQPVPLVIVYAANSQGFVNSALTDAAGHYAMGGFEAGTYRIILGDESAPGLSGMHVTLDAANRSGIANFSFAMAGQLAGTVFQAGGTSVIAGALVTLVHNGEVVLSMLTDERGKYVFDLTQTGTYQIEASADGRAFPARTGVMVSAGSNLTGINFVAGSAVLSGTVTDAATGAALAGATVTINRATSGLTQTVVATVATAADGSFSVNGLVAGPYRIVAAAAGHAFRVQSINVVAAGPNNVAMTLGSEGGIQGTVTDAGSGAAIANAQIILSSDATSAVTRSDDQGAFSFLGLAAGTYTLAYLAVGHQTAIRGGIVVSQGNQTANASLAAAAITVTGTVVNTAGPLGNVYVMVTDPSGLPLAFASTALDGTYTLSTLPPGTYSVTTVAHGYFAAQSASFTVANGQSVQVPTLTPAPVGIADTYTTTQSFIDYVGEVNRYELTPQQIVKLPVPEAFTLSDADNLLLQKQYDDSECAVNQQIAQSRQRLLLDREKLLRDTRSDIFRSLQSPPDVKGAVGSLKLLMSASGAINKVVDKLTSGLPFEKQLAVSAVGQLAIIQPGEVQKLQASYKNLLKSFTNHNTVEIDMAEAEIKTMSDQLFDKTVFLAAMLAQFRGLDGSRLAVELKVDSNKAVLAGLLKLIPKNNDPGLEGSLALFEDEIQAALTGLVDLVIKPGEVAEELGELNKHLANYKTALNDYLSAIDSFNASLGTLGNCDHTTPKPVPQLPQIVDFQFKALSLPAVSYGSLVSFITRISTSQDPNDITGPAGYGSQGFIQPMTFPYRVDFENDPQHATAAAQIVTITMTLDTDLDPSTLQFTGFGFGPFNFTVPAGLGHYQTTIDLRPRGIDLLVPVTLDVNSSTGALAVTFASLNPMTRLAPDGINDGFLPIDNANGDGQGYFTYTVKPKAGRPTGTAIHAQASIVFDTNDPLVTPTALNTLDINPPTSSVNSLPANTQGASIPVSWTGSDGSGSGIAGYTVYVSVDGGNYAAWLTNTTQTSGTYDGAIGHSYSFYSVAMDNVGLVEGAPTVADATTTTVPPPPNTPNLVGYPQFAVGSDVGGSSSVSVYNPDGSRLITFDPFPGTTGGVRTAIADFNGDGTPDLAVGSGPGAVAEVKIYDGRTQALIFDVFPFETFTGGVFVAAGDVTGDGSADIVITPDLSGGPRVEIFRGGDFALIANFFGIDDPAFRGGARAAVGDVNGDGSADLVISAGFGGGPRISIYDGAGLTLGARTHVVSDFFFFEPSLRNGAYVAVGDVNGDGYADLIGGGGPGGGPRVLIISGLTVLTSGMNAAFNAPIANYFAGNMDNRGGVRVSVKNLDDDEKADVVVGDGSGAGSRVTAYLGSRLAAGEQTDTFGFDAIPGFTGGVFVG